MHLVLISLRHLSKRVSRAASAPAGAIQHVGADHGCLHVLMPEQFLYDPDVIAPVESMRRKGMAEGAAPAAVGGTTARVTDAFLTSSV